MSIFEERTSRDGKRKRFVYYPAESGPMIKLEISHREGGRNYFSGANEKRGIEIMASQIEVGDGGNGVMMETSMMVDNVSLRLLVLETPRYNAKKLEIVASTFEANAAEISAKLVANRKEALELLQQTATAAAANASM